MLAMQGGKILKANQVETRVIHVERVICLIVIGRFGYNRWLLYKTDIQT